MIRTRLLVIVACTVALFVPCRADDLATVTTAALEAPAVPTSSFEEQPRIASGPLAREPASFLVPLPITRQVAAPVTYQEIAPSPVSPTPAPVLIDLDATRRFESTWYTRVDYFFWGERVDGQQFMTNNGAMPTLGYQQRYGQQRFRAELFGSRVGYSADGIASVTDYLGLLGEYEGMYEPQWWPSVSLFGGFGTRFFVRSFPDILIDPSNIIEGYQEAWWTFYPYIGIERRRTLDPTWEFYWRARIGVTAFTREHITRDDITLFPRANLTGLVELGFRGQTFYLSAYFEGMSWTHSPTVVADNAFQIYQAFQPNSQLFFIGLKSGFSY